MGVDGDEGSCIRSHIDLWGISHVSISSVINWLRLFLLYLFRGAQVIMCLSTGAVLFLTAMVLAALLHVRTGMF